MRRILKSIAICCLSLLLLMPAALAENPSVQIAKNDLSINDSLPRNVRTILLLLYDPLEGSAYGPSETMLLASINNDTGEASMTILQPQLLVSIPQVGEAPLSMAYAYGGENLAMKAVNELLNLNVRDCMSFDMNRFSEIIDLVGKLRITLDGTDAAALELSAGAVELDAAQAVAYMRLPKDDPQKDRQYTVFRQALYQGTHDKNLMGITELMSKVLGVMESNIGFFDLAGIAGKVFGGGNQQELYLPNPAALTPTEWEGQTAYTTDAEAMKTELYNFLYQ